VTPSLSARSGFEDTFAQVTARLLERSGTLAGRRCEAMNFGVSGYNSAQEVHLFERKVLSFGPDAVVLAYVLNDSEPTLFYSSLWTAGRSA